MLGVFFLQEFDMYLTGGRKGLSSSAHNKKYCGEREITTKKLIHRLSNHRNRCSMSVSLFVMHMVATDTAVVRKTPRRRREDLPPVGTLWDQSAATRHNHCADRRDALLLSIASRLSEISLPGGGRAYRLPALRCKLAYFPPVYSLPRGFLGQPTSELFGSQE